jgi:hypothetical protein
MKAIMLVLTVLLASLLSGCGSFAVKQSAMPTAIALVGCYISEDGTGYNILRLRLKSDMTYKAVIWGDIGSWGSAAGSWQIEGASVMLMATTEKEQMKGFVGPLAVRHGFLQGFSLDLSTSINKENAKLGWYGWSSLTLTTCTAAYSDEALSPSSHSR